MNFTQSEFNSSLRKHSVQPTPDPSSIPSNSEKHYLVVDSRMRNELLYPNPNKYELQLEECLNEVVGIDILKADVPFSRYKIHSGNNKLQFTWGGTKHTITIRTGDYFGSPDEVFLATEIQSKMNTAIGVSVDNPDINVSYDSLEDKIVFKNEASSPKPSFSITAGEVVNQSSGKREYLDNSIGKTLGMKPKTYDMIPQGETNEYYIIPDYRHQFEKDSYILLRLKAGGQRAEVLDSVEEPIKSSFAVIDRNEGDLNKVDVERIGKTFPTRLNSLSKLRIEFVDIEGREYDFQNKEHRIEFLVRTNDKGYRANDISTNFLDK